MRLLIVFIASVMLVSCKKYLDKKPDNGYVVPQSLTDLQALLDDAFAMNQARTPSLGEASADAYFVLQANFENMSTWQQNIYKWVADDNYVYANDWSINYVPVYNANYSLEMLEENPRNEANKQTWDNVKGSALFFRAYYFLQLVWSYGKAYDASTADTDLGIPLRTSSDFNLPSKRATIKECYEKIISDARESLQLLPALPTHPFRPSKAAAYGLLARTYLSMRDYANALENANKALEIKADLLDFNGDSDIGTTTRPFRRFNKETVFYTEMNLFVPAVNSLARIDTLLYASYADNDKRKSLYFQKNGNYYTFRGSYSQVLQYFTGIATDELLLIRAECLARQDNASAAMTTLSELLIKRYDASFVAPEPADASEALSIILEEREKELLFRGVRFSDIKRLNKEGADITPTRLVTGQLYSIAPNDSRYALPLPREIVMQTGMPQN